MVLVEMSSGDLRVPNVPLAHMEDDMASNDSSSTSGDGKRSDDVTTTNIDDELNNTQRGQNSDRESFGDEALSGSLENLVETFDAKINHCFKNLDETTQEMAPVQIRTQDEIMNESQIWWTLTGNFGNILPLDWSKTQSRKLQLPTLNLRPKKEGGSDDAGLDLSGESDDELRQALDMHQLIGARHPTLLHDSPPQTADQVIEEIDEMLQSCDLTGSVMTDHTMESVDSMYSSMRSPLPASSMMRDPDMDAKIKEAAALASSPENLRNLSYSKLVALQSEMEQLIQVYNESLVQELALKDELDFEKEIKNTFISLLLSIQNKRRHFANDRKRKGGKIDPKSLPQYVTACVPYRDGSPPQDNSSLQALIKILRAINEDNPCVSAMLTEYILTVFCPSSNSAPTDVVLR